MKGKWITFEDPSEKEQWNDAEHHLSRREHCRIDVVTFRFHEYAGKGHAKCTDDKRDATGERGRTFAAELIGKNDCDARDAEQYAAHLRPRDALIWNEVVSEHKSKCRNDRMQHRRKSRGNSLLSPKKETVVDKE